MLFKGLKRNDYSTTWDEAFPIGNGTIGGLVFGNPLNETIITNHEELFLPLPENADSRPYNGKPYVDGMRKLIFEGKYKEAIEYYFKGLNEDGCPYNTIVWTNPFEVATTVNINILNASEADVSELSNRLYFATGECETGFLLNNEKVLRKAFVSRSRDIMAIELSKEGKPIDVSVSLSLTDEARYISSSNAYSEGEILVLEATHSEDESGFVSAARVMTDGLTESSKDGLIKISKANHVLIYYSLSPWKSRLEASKVKLIRTLEKATADREVLFKEHEMIHRDLFEKVTVNFSDSEEEYTNEELLDSQGEGELSPELLERMCDFGRYLEIASFGKLPPNLQGVWNGNVTPPWSSDYTLDENIQMMMWQALPGGLSQFSKNYFDWLESYTEDFKKNAQSYYGCHGVFAAARVSTDGYHRHFSADWPMIIWTAGAGWLSSEYEKYYEFTGDENVLLRGIKYWKEVVRFYEDFLVTGEDGKFVFVPSYSPENTPLNSDSPVAINATMDIAVCKEVYTNLINACRLLNIETESIDKWEHELDLLPAYKVNEDGAIKEWAADDLKDDYHHRHSSHLYPVFPGDEVFKNDDEELINACHVACKKRLLDGVEAISGWGLAHLANISARLEDEKLWTKALSRLINVFTLKNLFTTHNPHELFQMDANLGLTSAVYEMIAYSDSEKIKFFPVWCDEFKNLKVSGLRLKGVVRVKRLIKNADFFNVYLESQGKKDMKIVLPKGFSLENGDTSLTLMAGESLEFTAFRR